VERKERAEMLARLSDAELMQLVALVPGDDLADLVILEGPTIGMVMCRVVEDALGEVFNLGEVLVTECLVRIGAAEGWAMVMGSRPGATRAAATIDAALAAGRIAPDLIDEPLARLIAAHDAALEAERTALAATRVRFETQ